MSGIRACDDELLRLGLTLPGFVERSKTIASLPSLGLLTLAGMTPACHEIDYVEIEDISGLGQLPGPYGLVAISSYSAQIDEAYELARRYRDSGVPVVLGGPHVTALPDEALANCDAVAVGEGESSWLEIVEDASSGHLAGLYGERDGPFDLVSAPMPAFELLDISKYNRLTVQTSRGCNHRCEFCASSVMLTRKFKQKPVSNVIAELDRIQEIWERPFIEFADDNTFVNKAYGKELLTALKGRHLKWFTETDISVSEDAELLSLMHDTGCHQVLIGLESPVELGLAGIELRSDWKARKWPEYRDAIRRIQSHGITVNGCFVVGLDGQTPDIFDEIEQFVSSSGLYEVQITIMTPFPGTPLYERLRLEERLTHDGDWRRCTLFDLNFVPEGMTEEQLRNGFRDLAVRLYSEEATAKRRDQFRDNLRAGR